MSESEKALNRLKGYIEQLGGELPEGWRVEVKKRVSGSTAGATDAYFYSPNGKRYRSRSQIAEALGLQPSPSAGSARAKPEASAPLGSPEQPAPLSPAKKTPGAAAALRAERSKRARLLVADEGLAVPLKLDNGLTLHKVGFMESRPRFCGGRDRLFPVGYQSSFTDGQGGDFVSEIVADASGPRFRVRLKPPGSTSGWLLAERESADEAWKAVVTLQRMARKPAAGQPTVHKPPAVASPASSDAPAAASAPSSADGLSLQQRRAREREEKKRQEEAAALQLLQASPEVVAALRAAPALAGVSGTARFGLLDVRVLKLLEALPGVEECSGYHYAEQRGGWAAVAARLLQKQSPKASAKRPRAAGDGGAAAPDGPGAGKKPSTSVSGAAKPPGGSRLEAQVAAVMRSMLNRIEKASNAAEKPKRSCHHSSRAKPAVQPPSGQGEQPGVKAAKAAKKPGLGNSGALADDLAVAPGAALEPAPDGQPVGAGLLTVQEMSAVVDIWQFFSFHAAALDLEECPCAEELEAALAAPDEYPEAGEKVVCAVCAMLSALVEEAFGAVVQHQVAATGSDSKRLERELQAAAPVPDARTWPAVAAACLAGAALGQALERQASSGLLSLSQKQASDGLLRLHPQLWQLLLCGGGSAAALRPASVQLPSSAGLSALHAMLAREDARALQLAETLLEEMQGRMPLPDGESGEGAAPRPPADAAEPGAAAGAAAGESPQMREAEEEEEEEEEMARVRVCRQLLQALLEVKVSKQEAGELLALTGSSVARHAPWPRVLDLRCVAARLDAGMYCALGRGGPTLQHALAADVRRVCQSWRAATLRVPASAPEELQLGSSQLADAMERCLEKMLAAFPQRVADIRQRLQSLTAAAEPLPPAGQAAAGSGRMELEEQLSLPFGEHLEACTACWTDDDRRRLIICDGCDTEYHTYCLQPPLEELPGGSWHCPSCCQLQQRRCGRLQDGERQLPIWLPDHPHRHLPSSDSSHLAIAAGSSPADRELRQQHDMALQLLQRPWDRQPCARRVAIIAELCRIAGSCRRLREHTEEVMGKKRALNAEIATLQALLKKQRRQAKPKAGAAAAPGAAGGSDAAAAPSKADGKTAAGKPGSQRTRSKAEEEDAQMDEPLARSRLEAAQTELRQLLIRQPFLGHDRHWRRYWLAPPAAGQEGGFSVLVQAPGSGGRAGGGGSGDGPWQVYQGGEQVGRLLRWMNPLGRREAQLHQAVLGFREQLLGPKRPAGTAAAAPEAIAPAPQDGSDGGPVADAEADAQQLVTPAEPQPSPSAQLRSELLEVFDDLQEDAFDSVWGGERRRQRWRCGAQSARTPAELAAALVVLEGMLQPALLRPRWQLWSFPALDPRGPWCCGDSVAAVALRLAMLRGALRPSVSGRDIARWTLKAPPEEAVASAGLALGVGRRRAAVEAAARLRASADADGVARPAALPRPAAAATQQSRSAGPSTAPSARAERYSRRQALHDSEESAGGSGEEDAGDDEDAGSGRSSDAPGVQQDDEAFARKLQRQLDREAGLHLRRSSRSAQDAARSSWSRAGGRSMRTRQADKAQTRSGMSLRRRAPQARAARRGSSSEEEEEEEEEDDDDDEDEDEDEEEEEEEVGDREGREDDARSSEVVEAGVSEAASDDGGASEQGSGKRADHGKRGRESRGRAAGKAERGRLNNSRGRDGSGDTSDSKAKQGLSAADGHAGCEMSGDKPADGDHCGGNVAKGVDGNRRDVPRSRDEDADDAPTAKRPLKKRPRPAAHS